MKFVLLCVIVVVAVETYRVKDDRCPCAHEYYSHGYDPCPPQTCEARLVGIVCTAVVRPFVKGCRCEEGYVRDNNNKCISEAECLKNKNCLGPNEYRDCGSACDNECATLGKQNRTNCPIVNIKCNDMCYCKDGFYRDKSHICVPMERCGH